MKKIILCGLLLFSVFFAGSCSEKTEDLLQGEWRSEDQSWPIAMHFDSVDKRIQIKRNYKELDFNYTMFSNESNKKVILEIQGKEDSTKRKLTILTQSNEKIEISEDGGPFTVFNKIN